MAVDEYRNKRDAVGSDWPTVDRDRAKHFASVAPERAHLAMLACEAAGSLTEPSRRLPVRAIDPRVHQLIEGPIQRRRFLDWAVFHVEQTFLAQLATPPAGAPTAQRRLLRQTADDGS